MNQMFPYALGTLVGAHVDIYLWFPEISSISQGYLGHIALFY